MLYAINDTYRELASFEKVDDLNEAVRFHKANNDLTTTDESVLNVIARHACKFVGVCFLRKAKIAEQVGKSARTIVRVCNKLEKLGIIKQYAMQRKNGNRMQTANAIVVQVANVIAMSDQETNNLKQNIKNLNNTKETKPDSSKTNMEIPVSKEEQASKEEQPKQQHDPKKALANSLPKGFYEFMSPFVETAEELYNYMGALYKAKAHVDKSVVLEEHVEDYAVPFLNVMRKASRGKVQNVMGYLYKAFESATMNIVRARKQEQLNDLASFYYDF